MNSLLCLLLAAICCTSVVLGQSSCSTDSDCSSFKGTNCRIKSPCKKGLCVCPQGQWLTGGQCQNLPSGKTLVNLGGTCSVNSDCGPLNVNCVSSKCTCADNYTPAGDNMNCQPYSNGQTCSGNNICGSLGNGGCSNGKCTCNSGYQWASGGDINQPGGCVSSSSTINVGQGATCSSALNWLTDSASSLKYCGSNLSCQQCPEGGSWTCMSGSSSLTVTVATLVMAAVCGLLLGRL